MEKLALITSCIFKRARAAGGEESSILGGVGGGGAGGRWRCEQSERDGEAPPGDIDPFPLRSCWAVVGAPVTSLALTLANASFRGIQRRADATSPSSVPLWLASPPQLLVRLGCFELKSYKPRPDA